ncbi:MAG TPA: DUF1996 domain-containing protein [Gemmatimonadaceae bacterium]|jgi:hypothetical protein
MRSRSLIFVSLTLVAIFALAFVARPMLRGTAFASQLGHGAKMALAANDSPPPAAIPVPKSWAFCVNAGNVCLFDGLRVVRLSTADGSKSVMQVAYHTVPCAVYGFQNRNPSNGDALHCDYGPALMDTLPIPQAMGPLTAQTIVVPKASNGSATQDVQDGGGNGSVTDGSGSFRTTCSLSRYGFDDPIVFPKRHGVSHLHMFFGNVLMDGFTDTASIRNQGNSTCRGGILNRTGYWTPAVIDANGNAVLPEEAIIYYKTGFNMPPANVHPMPTGLRMVAGDKNAKGQQEVPGPMRIAVWSCLSAGFTSVKGQDGNDIQGGYVIPATCPTGALVRLTIVFPQCWNGKDLDSPDHKSHMSYPEYSSSGHFTSKCPSSHPVQLPEVTEHFDFAVLPGAKPATWHLASDMDMKKPGGLSAHADWMMGWDPPTMKSLVENCLQKGVDCGVGGLGANRALF